VLPKRKQKRKSKGPFPRWRTFSQERRYVIPSNWRDLTATRVFRDNWPQRNAMFCDGLTGPKSLVSRSHSCARFPGCGISFCGGFGNSAKPLPGNSHTKFPLMEECLSLRACLARSDERPRDHLGPLPCLRTQRARVDSREFSAKIQQQRRVVDPCDDDHQRTGGSVSGSRHTLPDIKPNDKLSSSK
jgi:hypothetical protein